jgi:hypothetical protein
MAGIEMTAGTNVLVRKPHELNSQARRGTLTGPVRYSESPSTPGGVWFWVPVDFGDGEPVQVSLEHVRHVRAAA